MNCCFAKIYNFPSADYKHNNVCMNSVEIDWRLGLVVLFMEKISILVDHGSWSRHFATLVLVVFREQAIVAGRNKPACWSGYLVKDRETNQKRLNR